MEQQFTMLTWNCRSLQSNLSCFKIKLYAIKPHVAFLTETWLQHGREPRFVNYRGYYKHRENRPHGGLAILVRNDIAILPKDVQAFPGGKIEFQSLTMINNNLKYDLLNIYNPGENISEAEYLFYFEQLNERKIVTGDMNAHHQIWDSNHPNNTSGNNLVNSLFQTPDLALITPQNLPTYHHPRTGTPSTLDLCLVSQALVPLSEVYLESDIGSDHNPVITKINIIPTLVKIKCRGRWKFRDEGWNDYRKTLPSVDNTEISDQMVFEEVCEQFNNNILNTAKSIFHLNRNTVTPKYSKPWWSEKCSEVVRAKRIAKNLFHRHPTILNMIALRRAEACVKYEIKKSKRESWQRFSSSINSLTPTKTIYQKVARIQGSLNMCTNPIITDNGIETDPQAKSDLIADNYEIVFNSPNPDTDTTPMLMPLSIALCSESNLPYNSAITETELNRTLLHIKSTSPGEDQIHYHLLKNLPRQYKELLLNLYNYSFRESHIPPTWKKACIIPILKPGKMPHLTTSYRPISLLSCVGKVLEKIVADRLTYVLESNNAFSSTQAGFRRRLSTMDQIARFEKTVRKAIAEKKIMIAVFFDLSNAFDRVWHFALLYKLASVGVEGRVLKWLQNYLRGRKFNVYFEGEYSRTREITSGVPQGSILSPILFNVMVSDIPSDINVTTSEYADDITIYSVSDDIQQATRNTQIMIDKIEEWCCKWGLKMNYSKTKAMLFTRKRVVSNRLTIGNFEIDFVNQHKFLGMTLDAPQLKWKPHLRILKDNCLQKVNVLKCIAHHKWGADRATLLKLYKTLVRSRLDYGCEFYSSANRAELNRLNVIQNTCLRTATGARKTSPIVSLEVESNVMPLHIHRAEIILKRYNRLMQLPDNLRIIQELANDDDLANIRWNTNTNVPPFTVRCKALMSEYNLNIADPMHTSQISPFPPWLADNKYTNTHFSDTSTLLMSDVQANQLFLDMITNSYLSFLQIFTDGSKIVNPNSTSAAFVVPELGEMRKWKLQPDCTILGAELFAIYKALDWVANGVLEASGIVILTDSMSSVAVIQNLKPRTYLHMVYRIQRLIMTISNSCPVIVQYIPAHKNIMGNEMADLAAKAGHAEETSGDSVISKEERNRIVKETMMETWQIVLTGKGKKLAEIKSKIAYWPWSENKKRIVETSMARLRIGHAGLNEHLNRFNLSDNKYCQCGIVENVEHFLLECMLNNDERCKLYATLHKLGVPPSLKNILGGGDFPSSIQDNIVNSVAEFLFSTGRLFEL